MKNVFDIRTDNENYVVIPKGTSVTRACGRALIAIYLYYEDTVGDYYPYIDPVVSMDNVDVVFITTSEKIRQMMTDRYGSVTVLIKQNRGRDVAALMVAVRDIISKYKYFCFVHDKKGVKEIFRKDATVWIRSMWENMIASDHYIRNVIDYFENHKECGLLVPPEPIGDYYSVWFRNSWMDDYEMTSELAIELGLDADISPDKSPISYGTVLWGRTAAFYKLFQKKWKYSDFVEEPMPYDGTISHAIERIFPYVAQDAGYETKTLMTDSYCATLLSYLQSTAFDVYSVIRKYLEIVNIHDMKNVMRYEISLPDFFERKRKVYLYGAGAGGRACLHILRVNGLKPDGFIVSHVNGKVDLDGLKIYSLSEVPLSDDCGVIVTVINDDARQEIYEELAKYPNIECINWHEMKS